MVYTALLLFKVRRRAAWLRFTAAESEFWKRFGAPQRVVDLIRRFGESRFSTICLGVVALLFALLMALNAGAYLYFKQRLSPEKHPPASTPSHRS